MLTQWSHRRWGIITTGMDSLASVWSWMIATHHGWSFHTLSFPLLSCYLFISISIKTRLVIKLSPIGSIKGSGSHSSRLQSGNFHTADSANPPMICLFYDALYARSIQVEILHNDAVRTMWDVTLQSARFQAAVVHDTGWVRCSLKACAVGLMGAIHRTLEDLVPHCPPKRKEGRKFPVNSWKEPMRGSTELST